MSDHDTPETIIAAVREWQEAWEAMKNSPQPFTRLAQVDAAARALRALILPPAGFAEERDARLMSQQHDMGRVAGWNDAMKGEKGPVMGYRERHES